MTDTTEFELAELREAIRDEYRTVVKEPETGFHFHTRRSTGDSTWN